MTCALFKFTEHLRLYHLKNIGNNSPTIGQGSFFWVSVKEQVRYVTVFLLPSGLLNIFFCLCNAGGYGSRLRLILTLVTVDVASKQKQT